MAQTARVTLTLSNIATEEDLRSMEERLMSALSEAIGTLTEAVNAAVTRMGSPDELQAALAEERRLRTELIAAEEAEDVEQNAELAAVRAEVDRLLAEQSGAATELVGLAGRLNAVGTAVEEAPDETPVGEVPVDVPDAGPVDVPDAGVPADGGAPDEAAPTDGSTDDLSSPETTDAAGSTDGTPADDAPAAAPAGGPVDANGNPVEAPRL